MHCTQASHHNLHPPSPHLPAQCEFFYTDSIHITESNVMPLLALARQLLVGTVDSYCTDFVAQRLGVPNCLRYLRQAVTFQLSDIQKDCVTLAAQGAHGVAPVWRPFHGAFAIAALCLLCMLHAAALWQSDLSQSALHECRVLQWVA